MKVAGYIIGSLEILSGLITIIVTSIIKEIMPKAGYAAYQMGGVGGYSELHYELDFILPNSLALLLVTIGFGTIIYFCWNKKYKR